MKNLALIFLSLALIVGGCRKNNVKDQLENIIVVNGFLVTGEPIQGIKIEHLLPYEEVDLDPLNVEVSIIYNDTKYQLEKAADDTYHYPNQSLLVTDDSEYILQITNESEVVSASMNTPRPYIGVSHTGTTINPANEFSQIDITFIEEQEDVFYLIKLKSLEDAPVLIDWEDGVDLSPRSVFLYNSSSSTISLLVKYFEYYGTYQADVYRINEAYYLLFKDKLNDQFYTQSGNILGGKGFFVGTDKYSFEIEIEQ